MSSPEIEAQIQRSDTENLTGADGRGQETRYVAMLLQLDRIPWWHNFIAAVSTWIVLAAYLVVPGTFTNLQDSNVLSAGTTSSTPLGAVESIGNKIINGATNNIGLLATSAILAGLGVFNCTILYFLHWHNYVWLEQKIFQPMTLNAFAGVLTTVVNVYTVQKGKWSVPAQINVIVAGGVATVAGLLMLLYHGLLQSVISTHRMEYGDDDRKLLDPIKERALHRVLPSIKRY